jgi:hypothetical protein
MRGGLPHEADFIQGEAVGFVHGIAEAAFELQDLGGWSADESILCGPVFSFRRLTRALGTAQTDRHGQILLAAAGVHLQPFVAQY